MYPRKPPKQLEVYEECVIYWQKRVKHVAYPVLSFPQQTFSNRHRIGHRFRPAMSFVCLRAASGAADLDAAQCLHLIPPCLFTARYLPIGPICLRAP